MKESHAEHITKLNETHAEKMAELEDTCDMALKTTKAFYNDTIEHIKNAYAVERQDMRFLLDRAQKRTNKLEGDLRTIAENRGKCNKVKKENDAILEAFLAGDKRDDWSELWE